MHGKILADATLTPDEKLVLLVLTRFGSRGRNMHPGAEKLAGLTGYHPEAVRRMLKRLCDDTRVGGAKLVMDLAPIRGRRAATYRFCNAYLPDEDRNPELAVLCEVPNPRLDPAFEVPNPGLGHQEDLDQQEHVHTSRSLATAAHTQALRHRIVSGVLIFGQHKGQRLTDLNASGEYVVADKYLDWMLSFEDLHTEDRAALEAEAQHRLQTERERREQEYRRSEEQFRPMREAVQRFYQMEAWAAKQPDLRRQLGESDLRWNARRWDAYNLAHEHGAAA